MKQFNHNINKQKTDKSGTFYLGYAYQEQVKKCKLKVKFTNRKEARQVCKSYVKAGMFRREYACPICHYWHISHNQPRLALINHSNYVAYEDVNKNSYEELSM